MKKSPAYVGFDTETLGLEVRRPENMLQLSMVYENTDPKHSTINTPVDKLDHLTLIIDPGQFIDQAELDAILMNTWILEEISKSRKGLVTKYPVVSLRAVPYRVQLWMSNKPQLPYLVGQNVGAFDSLFLPPDLLKLFHYRMLEIGSAFYDPAAGPVSLGEAKAGNGFNKTVAHDARCEAMDYILLLRKRHGGDLTPY